MSQTHATDAADPATTPSPQPPTPEGLPGELDDLEPKTPDGVPGDAAEPAAPPTPEARIAELEGAVSLLRDQWLRAEAEGRNAAARAKKDIEAARSYAIQKFAGDVVEAAQNLRRGLEALPAPEPGEPELLGRLREGFEGVERSLLAMLERHGVVRRDAAGQPFDPELHQAMSEQPAPDGVTPGTVLSAWTPAWTLNGRLLKPAMVVVAAATETAAAS